MTFKEKCTQLKNHPIDYRSQVRNRYFYFGIILIISGILDFFSETIIIDLVAGIIFALFIIGMARMILSKKEVEDEMAYTNLNRAALEAMLFGHIIIILFDIVVTNIMRHLMNMSLDITPHLSSFVFFFVGIQSIAVYIRFIQLEDN